MRTSSIDRVKFNLYTLVMRKIRSQESLAKRLEHLISSLKINQREFAQRVGFTQSYISLILNGSKKTPSERFYNAAAREFSVNPNWLKTGAGETFQVPGLSLSSNDAEIIARYKLLPSSDQVIVGEIMNALLVKTLSERS